MWIVTSDEKSPHHHPDDFDGGGFRLYNGVVPMTSRPRQQVRYRRESGLSPGTRVSLSLSQTIWASVIILLGGAAYAYVVWGQAAIAKDQQDGKVKIETLGTK